MNKPFTTLTATAVPLMMPNVDTDVIVRIERLATVEKADLAPYAFEALRRLPDGSDNPASILNDPRFAAAEILLAAENFGCGSSREGAVWAIEALGIRCVIAPSYGDIFFSNCFQNGVLPISLPEEQVRQIAQTASEGTPITVDLGACTIGLPTGVSLPFDIDPLRREGLLLGLDDIGLTLQADDNIRQWQAVDRARRPWAWPAVASGHAVA